MDFSWHDTLLIVIPFLISWIVRPDWDPRLKYGITLLFCVAASAIEFYFAVYLVGGVQTTFFEAFSKSFLVIFATYAAVLKAPRLLLPSIQVNIDAGHLPEAEENGVSYIKIPVRKEKN